MSYLLKLPTYEDDRGQLTVIEDCLPFTIKRFYCIYGVKSERGGHRHLKTTQALLCVSGSCEIYLDDGIKQKTIVLDNPNKCLIVEPADWHLMRQFSNHATLLVFASELYNPMDYIEDKPL
ncbi:sugar 3,4-ketoisomerase [Psychrobacter sp.]|uniref:sugar 3,4-ketoisomerase n=1 Tax=Psychrobacter sp. TaxID=56811 RepID=UPI003BAF29E1